MKAEDEIDKDFTKMIKVILSSKTQDHLKTSWNMYKLLQKKYEDCYTNVFVTWKDGQLMGAFKAKGMEFGLMQMNQM